MASNREEIVVRERQIEDILATYTDLLGQMLGASTPLRVLARQLELPDGGRLDLICLGGGQLHLVEIKVEPACTEFVRQTARYLAQIPTLQQQGELPTGSVQGYLLSPRIPPRLLPECQQYQIHAIEYAPSRVLQHFYMNFQQHLSFNRLIPIAQPKFTKTSMPDNPLLKVPPASRGNRTHAVPLAKRGEP